MNFHLHWIDVDEHLQNRVAPVVRYRRDDSAIYWAATKELLSAGEYWAMTARGDCVMVPMVAYRTATQDQGSILATGVELGFRAVEGLRHHHRGAIHDVYLFMGNKVHEIEDESHRPVYRLYLGLMTRGD